MSTPSLLRYRAFLSYSHRDAKKTARLHRRLEAYRLPKSLVPANRERQTSDASLRPIFRDRDELASAAQLSRAIEAALDESAALVVVCSPAAAASRWVGEEIRYFRSNYPKRPVFAFVVAGEPGLDPRVAPGMASIPLDLLLVEPADPTGPLGEPIAADARKEGDGFSAAFLKLAAGLLSVSFDQLRRREYRRRQLRWTIAGSVSMLLAITFAALAWMAMAARDQARSAQAIAELELISERQTRNFLLSIFHLADARESRGSEISVREVLDQAVARIDSTAFARPVIKSRYLASLGQAYSSLGLNKRAVELLQQSLQGLAWGGSQDGDAGQRIDSQIELADVLFDMGDYPAALASIDSIGSDQTPSRVQRARAANVRGDILAYMEQDTTARQSYEAALISLAPGAPEAESASIRARSTYGLALLNMYAGAFDAADQQFTETVALLQSTVGDKHPETIAAVLSRGSNAYNQGNLVKARQWWSEALHTAEQVFDRDHPQIGTIKNNLGRLLLETGELRAAEPMIRAAISSDRRHRSSEFDDLAFSLGNLAIVRMGLGDASEARALLQEALPIAENSGHRMLPAILTHLADLECSDEAGAAGLPLAERAVQACQGSTSSRPWQELQAKITLAYCKGRNGAQVNITDVTAMVAEAASLLDPGSPFSRRMQEQLAYLKTR